MLTGELDNLNTLYLELLPLALLQAPVDTYYCFDEH